MFPFWAEYSITGLLEATTLLGMVITSVFVFLNFIGSPR